MLGVNATTESVSRFNESRLAPNIGLEAIWSLHDSGLSKTHTRRSGQPELISLSKPARMIFDN
jgi:hypothetical protein